ncbi:hypothetical protein [Clostridium sp.]|uniref:hypothetical protein n=1 Tax=Clostridium sp. TaxID=1506 RepID=UPI003F34250D
MNNNLKVLEDTEIKYFWHNTIKNITLGFMMTSMTFSFLGLQYILPIIGVVLLYSGFRNLRNENTSLNTCWIFSIINVFLNMLNLIYITTPLNVNFQFNNIRMLLLMAFQLIFLIIFRKGLLDIFNKANTTIKKDPILKLIIWQVIVLICAITQLGQIIFISIPIIIYYFYIFKSLYSLSYDLETINYKPLKNSKGLSYNKLLLLYSISCVLIVLLCCIPSNHIKLDSKEIIQSKSSEFRSILIRKGFPGNILKDIDDEDISILQDIVHIESSMEDLIFESNKKTEKNILRATSIFIELKDSEMYVIEHFNWKDGHAYWNDGFRISSSANIELINGNLLYENKGANYSASIPRLSNEIIPTNNIFGFENENDIISGAINYPFGSINQRGYVFYKLDISNDIVLGSNLLNYTHYNNPFRIPYSEPENENLMFNDKLKQHYTNFRTKAYIDQHQNSNQL